MKCLWRQDMGSRRWLVGVVALSLVRPMAFIPCALPNQDALMAHLELNRRRSVDWSFLLPVAPS